MGKSRNTDKFGKYRKYDKSKKKKQKGKNEKSYSPFDEPMECHDSWANA
jgi:hypothetical protein